MSPVPAMLSFNKTFVTHIVVTKVAKFAWIVHVTTLFTAQTTEDKRAVEISNDLKPHQSGIPGDGTVISGDDLFVSVEQINLSRDLPALREHTD